MYEGNKKEIDFGSSKREVRVGEGQVIGSRLYSSSGIRSIERTLQRTPRVTRGRTPIRI